MGRSAAHTLHDRHQYPKESKNTMAKYLITFPSAAMVVPDGEWEAVGRFAARLHSGIGCSCRWHHDTLEMPTGIVIRKVSQA